MIDTLRMRKTSALVLLGALVFLAYMGVRAYAASSLFGGATLGPGHVILVSDGSDNPGNTANDFSGVEFDDVNGELFSNLAVLSTDFNVTDDGCGGGSPRFQISIDDDGDSVHDGNVFVYLGPSPGFASCTQNTWVSSGNLIGNNDAGRWDFTQLGGPLGGYSGAPANVLNGEILNISLVIDSYWNAPASGGDSEQTVLVDNVTIKKAVGETYTFDPPPPPPDVTVTIVKYIGDDHATAGNANSTSFPMSSCWDATNIGSSCGTFALSTVGFNNPNPYEATTADMSSGADYSTNEDTSTSVVGPNCDSGQEFRLVGYTTGDSLAGAESGTPTTTAPAFTNITTDTWVIVWNEPCGGGPVGPPPATACNSMTPPPGYTLQSGGSGSDTVVLAPNTMFRGNGGNDDVSGPDGNYVVCTGSGNDIINLGDGDQTVNAGGGGNQVTVGNGSGYISSGSGNDQITIGDGPHTTNAGGGGNTVTTGSGDQNVTAGSGNDTVTTGSGNDTVNAGGGGNTVTTNAGADSITTGSGNDTIDGGADTDTCSAGGGLNTVTNCP